MCCLIYMHSPSGVACLGIVHIYIHVYVTLSHLRSKRKASARPRAVMHIYQAKHSCLGYNLYIYKAMHSCLYYNLYTREQTELTKGPKYNKVLFNKASKTLKARHTCEPVKFSLCSICKVSGELVILQSRLPYSLCNNIYKIWSNIHSRWVGTDFS